jgi:mono/diheme cytochrome c family protein
LSDKIKNQNGVNVRYILPIALLFALTACSSSRGQSGDPVAGRAVARHICAECHLVAGPDPNSLQRGPAFVELAERTNISAGYLRAFLKDPHGEMPDIPLQPGDIEDLIAYILAMDD